jgi:hypothetical protein
MRDTVGAVDRKRLADAVEVLERTLRVEARRDRAETRPRRLSVGATGRGSGSGGAGSSSSARGDPLRRGRERTARRVHHARRREHAVGIGTFSFDGRLVAS